jgi:hypothetical protein
MTRDGGSRRKNLKMIQEPQYDDQIKIYVTCCLALCNCMTDIILADKLMAEDGDYYYKL